MFRGLNIRTTSTTVQPEFESDDADRRIARRLDAANRDRRARDPATPARAASRARTMGRRANAFPRDIAVDAAMYADPAFHAAAPDAYVCALTLRVMKNPAVVAKTGRTYEKAAIEAWIAINHTEPCDRRVTLEDFASTETSVATTRSVSARPSRFPSLSKTNYPE